MDLKETAQLMLWQLEVNRLSVTLTPAPEKRHPNHSVRIVEEHNPAWCRAFCSDFLANRTRPRRKKQEDTMIKRQHTTRALQEIANGQAHTKYAKRLLPYVQKFAHEFDELTAMRMAFGGG